MLDVQWIERLPGESAIKGLAAGAIAGAAGALAMSGFQRLLMSRRSPAAADHQQEDEGHDDKDGDGSDREGDPPTTKAGNAIAKKITGQELGPDGKKKADPIMHYAMGTFSGAVYGVASELAPVTKMGRGVAFGVVVWLLADELAVPALGLSPPTTQSPGRSHLEGLAAHFVYGFVTDVVRRLVRRFL
jgi:putative membrane protein